MTCWPCWNGEGNHQVLLWSRLIKWLLVIKVRFIISLLLFLLKKSSTLKNKILNEYYFSLGGQTATVKRRKKSAAAPNQKKMFEEAQMVRRVKAYLGNMKVITDEEKLHQLSVECEPHAGAVAIAAAVPLGGSRGRRHPSPTLSTTSSASSTSEGRKSIQGMLLLVY